MTVLSVGAEKAVANQQQRTLDTDINITSIILYYLCPNYGSTNFRLHISRFNHNGINILLRKCYKQMIINECVATERMDEVENTIFLTPKSIQKRIFQLNELVDTYPEKIPVIECAKYLKISDEGLRRAIVECKMTCAFSWMQSAKKAHGYYINTLLFYEWQMTGLAHRSMLQNNKHMELAQRNEVG